MSLDFWPRRPWLSRTRRDESGTATAEALLWVPVLLLICALIVDTSAIQSNRALALKIIQDENRSFATGKWATTDELQAAVKARLASISPTAVVTTTIQGGNRVRTTVSMRATEIDVVGAIAPFKGLSVFIWANHLIEGA